MAPYTRRDFTKLALAALPAAGFLSSLSSLRAADTKPAGKVNSKFRGVQVGLNVPYSFGNPAMNADEVLAACIEVGVSGLELRTQPVEAFLGAPSALVSAKNAVTKGPAAEANAARLRDWRASAPLARAAEFRKKYEAAGVLIEVVKVDGIFKMSDAELDYVFNLAKALGARALSTEISKADDDHKRVGRFADKHQFPIGYHGHATTTPAHWEAAFALAKYNYANVDLGHFVAGNNQSPVEFIKKHHARITHVHVKDRKLNNGGNTLFGQGDTPIAEVLRLIRDNKWPIQATIEFEYKVPEGSTRMAEIAKCVRFCRDALA
ncbi:MAG: sugar phosphate isomerase/epimerase [Verrucomicrobia bacterium]|nr:sugar phosphate isomerase/epimerase [Verrucomicrobiota bacterium]